MANGGEINFDALNSSVQKLVGSLDKLQQRVETVEKEVSGFDRIFGSMKNFDTFIATVKKLDDVSATSFKKVATGLETISNALNRLPSKAVNLTELNTRLGHLVEFTRNLSDLPAIDPARIESVVSARKMLEAIQKLGAVKGLDKIQIDPEMGRKLGEFLRNLTTFQVPTQGRGIAGFIGGFFKNFVQQVRVQDIAKFANVVEPLSRLAPSLVKLRDVVEGVSRIAADGSKIEVSKPLDTKKIAKTFAGLTLTLRLTSALLDKIPGGQALDDMSKVFQRLGIGLSGLSRAVHGIKLTNKDEDTVAIVAKTILKLGLALKGTAFLLQFGKSNNVKALVDAIVGISTAFKALSELSKFDIKTPKTKNIDQIAKIVTKVIGAFGKLRGFRKIPDLGPTMQGLAELFKVVGNAQQINSKAFDKLPQLVDKIATALQKLNGLRINARVGAAIGSQMQGLADLSRQVGAIQNINAQQTRLPSISGAAFNPIRTALDEGIRVAVRAASAEVARFISNVTNMSRRVADAVRQVGTNFQQLGASIRNVANRIQSSAGLGALTQSGGFQLAADFEQTTSRLQATGFTDEQIERAQEFADLIGIQYPLSANEAMQSILDLTRAGQQLSDIQFILPSAADLATLGEIDIGAATQGLIAAVGAFDEVREGVAGTFANTAEFADILAAAADVSTSSIESITFALQNVGPAANQAGLSFEETVAAITLFEEAGIRGAEAGTQLRSLLNALITPKARNELQRLGVSLFNADGTMRDLNSIIQDVNDAYERLGFTEAEILLSTQQLADAYGRQGLSILLANDGIEETVESMQGLDSASERARQSIDNLRGDFEQITGSGQTLLKDLFYPMIDRFFRPVAKLALNFINALLQLPPGFKEVISTGILLAASFATILGGILAVVGVLTQFGGAILAVVGSVAAFVLNVAPLVAALGALAGALTVALPILALLGVGFGAISATVNSFFVVIEDNIGGAGDALAQFQTLVTEAFVEISRVGGFVFRAIQALFGDVFGADLTRRGERVAGLFGRINTALQTFIDNLRAVDSRRVAEFFTFIRPQIERFVLALNSIGGGIFDVLVGDTSGVQRVQAGISQILASVTNLVQSITGIDLTSSLLSFEGGDILQGARNFVESLIAAIRQSLINNRETVRRVFEFFLRAVNPFNKISTLLRLFGLDKLADVFGRIGDQLNTALSGLVNTVLAVLGGGDIRTALNESFGQVGQDISRLIEVLYVASRQIAGIFSTIVDTLTSGLDISVDQNPLQLIVQGLTSAVRFLNTNVLIPLNQHLPAIIRNVTRFAGAFISTFRPLLPVLRVASASISSFVQTVIRFLAGFTNIETVLESAVRGIVSILRTLPLAIGGVVANLGEMFGSNFLVEAGRAIQQGDFGAFVGNLVRGILDAIPRAIRSLSLVLRGTVVGPLLEQIASGLETGNIGQIGSALVGLFFSAFQFVAQQIGNLLVPVASALFSGLQQLLGFTVSRAASGLGSAITNTLSFILGGFIVAAFEGIGTISDFVGRGINALGDFIGLIIRGVFSSFPMLLRSLAEGVADQFLKEFLNSLADLVDAIANSFATFVTLLIRSAGNAVRIFGAIATGIGRAVQLIRTVIGGILGFLANIVVGIVRFFIEPLGAQFSIIGNLIQSVVGAFGNLGQWLEQNAGMIAAAVGVITVAVIYFRTQLTLAQQQMILANAKFAVLGTAILVVGDAFVKAMDAVASGGDILDGILTFFQSIAESVLNLVDPILRIFGMDSASAISQMRENFRLLEIIGRTFIENLGNGFRRMADVVIVAFNDIRAGIENFFGNANRLNELVAIRTSLENTALSAADAFAQIAQTVRTSTDPMALEALLRQNAQQIMALFTRALAEEGGLQALQAEGTLDEVITGLISADAIPQAIAALQGDFNELMTLFSNLPEEQAARFFADFINAAIAGGANQVQIDQLNQMITRMLEQGAISASQANDLFAQLGTQATAVTEQVQTEAVAVVESIASLTEEVILRQAQAMVDLQTQLANGTISQEEYNAAVTESATSVLDFIEASRAAREADLSRQLNDGLITIEEYNAALADLNEEARNLTSQQYDQSIAVLNQQYAAGALTADEYATAVRELGTQLEVAQENIKRNTAIQDLNQQLREGKISAEEFADAVDKLDKAINASATGSVAGRLQTQLARQRSSEGVAPAGPVGDGSFVEGQDELNEALEEEARLRDEINDKVRDFSRDEARRIKEEIEAEREKEEELKELRDEVQEEAKKEQEEFDRETSQRALDQQRKIDKIQQSAEENLEEAILGRDSAAAQRALKQKQKDETEATEQFAIEEQRRIEEHQRTVAENELKRAERILEAEKELQELRDKNVQERLERQADFKAQLDEMRAESAEKAGLRAADAEAEIAATAEKLAITSQYTEQARAMFLSLAESVAAAAASIDPVRTSALNAGAAIRAGANPQLAVQNAALNAGNAIQNAAGSFDDFIRRNQIVVNNLTGQSGGSATRVPLSQGNRIQRFAQEGFVGRTGLAEVDRGEIIARPSTINNMMGGDTIQVNLRVNIEGGAGDTDALLQQFERRIIPRITTAIRQIKARKNELG